jgi:hypothetical protein
LLMVRFEAAIILGSSSKVTISAFVFLVASYQANALYPE